jgi:GNAT superfamily N-acetyltransferase
VSDLELLSHLEIRRATREDVPLIVAMLRDDHLGATRESSPDDPVYLSAFETIAADPLQWLVVGVRDGEVIATMQLTIIPGLSRRGARRALIEAVRVRSDHRKSGYGQTLVRWAVDKARDEGCVVIQLTTDKSRVDAHRFYERLGFANTHLGYKMAL